MRHPLATLFLALAASLSLACGTTQQPSATSGPTTTPTQTSAAASQPVTAPQPPAAANANIPSDLQYTPADIKYLNTLDADALALALQRRRDDLAAMAQMRKLNDGYTDSLKTWTISAAKKAR